MLVLLNSTKTMDAGGPRPAGLRGTQPRFRDEAGELAAGLTELSARELARVMDLSDKLADETRATLALWGSARRRAPALAAFTGLVYKHVGADELPAAVWRDAQRRLVILSGLYGALRPLDLVENYRLEMGSRFRPAGAANLVEYWRPRITASLRSAARREGLVLNLASQEYFKAVDADELPAPVISPVFKERRPDGGLKTAPVHGKIARGAMVRFVLENDCRRAEDLLAFDRHGWAPEDEPPAAGAWLFTRPVRG